MRAICTVRKVVGDKSTRYFLYPNNEITDDGKYSKIDKDRYPSKGTIWCNFEAFASRLEGFLEKAVIADLSKEEETFNWKPDSNFSKFMIKDFNAITSPNEDELIEIIYLSKDKIDDVLTNDEHRIIDLPIVPLNKQLIIVDRDNQLAYGVFEHELISEEFGNVRIKLFTKTTTNGKPDYHIKKYDLEEIAHLFWDIDIFRKDDTRLDLSNKRIIQKEFLYSTSLLEGIPYIEEIDFIEDRLLLNLIRNLFENDIQFTRNTIQKIKRTFQEHLNINMDFKEARIQRFLEKESFLNQLLDYRTQFIEEYLESAAGETFKKEYIKSNLEIISEVAKKDLQYNHQVEYLENEIRKKEEDISSYDMEILALKEEIKRLEEEKVKRLNEKNEYDEKILENRLSNLDALAKEKENKITELNEEIVSRETLMGELKEKYNLYIEYDKIHQLVIDKKGTERELGRSIEELTQRLDKLKLEYKDEVNTIISRFTADLKKPLNQTLMKVLKFEKTEPLLREYTPISDEPLIMDKDQLMRKIKYTFYRANRDYKEEDLLNYLICLTQGFITVFAGDPGVGKTSTCELISEALGVDKRRFCKVSVERGWTSSSDFIGYYNPLTKEFQKASTGVYDVLKQIDIERKHGDQAQPYLVLLDEANLSNIEYYWSKFNLLSDEPLKNDIQVSSDEQFQLTEGFKFLATINYDHTTEPLSPRFLDRAFLIKMDRSEFSAGTGIIDTDSENVDGIVSYGLLKNLFTPKPETQLKDHLEIGLKDIFKVMREFNQTISYRSHNSILNYCLVAQEYMVGTNRFRSLDYAISQKLLPSVNGVGIEYGKYLLELIDIFKKYSLTKSVKLLGEIIEKGKQNHHYYQFFIR